MSDLTNVFTDIADAIRAKTETQITYKPTEMADAINNISSGGGTLVYNANGVAITRWLNVPVTIAEGVTNTSNMLYGWANFNQPVAIPNIVTNTASMFWNCNNFNQPVTIPNSVTDTSMMFYYCGNFNQPVTISHNVTNVYRMFYFCYNFNQPVTISNSVTNTVQMLLSCSNFNQPITIPDSVTNTVSMLSGCSNFNQPVIISDNVANIQRMFWNCNNFGSNVYVYPANLTRQTVINMFYHCNNQLLKRIFTNDTNVFNEDTPSQTVVGALITWTQEGNNFYNTDFNIYIHNVANPYTILNNASYQFNSSSPLPDSPAIVFGNGVRDLSGAFYDVTLNSNNTLILFEEGIESLTSCFADQTDFNQPLTIPSSAVDCSDILSGCSYFNSPVIFRNGVEDISSAMSLCGRFNSDIWIPESVIAMAELLSGTHYTSGTVHISHNIALGDTTDYIYNSLVNGHIGITLDPSRILNDY